MNLIDSFVFSTRTDIRILRHLLFWLVDCFLVVLVMSADTGITLQIFLERLAIVPLSASVTYFIIYYLFPAYSKDHSWVRLTLGLFLAAFFMLYGMRYFRVFVVDPWFTN